MQSLLQYAHKSSMKPSQRDLKLVSPQSGKHILLPVLWEVFMCRQKKKSFVMPQFDLNMVIVVV